MLTYTAAFGALDPMRNDVLCLSNSYTRFTDQRRNARTVKLLSHLFVEADISVWIDANIQLLVPANTLVEMMGAADVAVFRHCERADIYEEAEAVIRMKKDAAPTVNEQMAVYRKRWYQAKDLGMTFILVRRHTQEVRRRNEQWFAELSRYSVRDQLSFPVVFDGLVKYWDPVPLTRSPYFIRHPHGSTFA